MKRLATFDRNIGNSDYKNPETPDTPYVVDDSSFVPMSEAIKQLGHVNSDGSDNSQYYDFPDGKDDGSKIPLQRTRNGKDIAEISSDIANKVEGIGNEIKKAQEFEQFKKDTQARMESMKSSAASKE